MQQTTPTEKPPVINCHTHVFTGKHVPPYLAKTFLWWPFYQLLTMPLIMRWFRFWFLNKKYSPYFYPAKQWYKQSHRLLYNYRAWIKRNPLLELIAFLINTIITVHALLYLLLFLFNKIGGANATIERLVQKTVAWLTSHHLLFFYQYWAVKAVIILFTICCIKSGRQLIWLVVSKIWAFIGWLPDKTTIAFLKRYVNIGRFAYYKHSKDIFIKLREQYTGGTGFVLLPMDMKYMDAGELAADAQYRMQMDELAKIKSSHPKEAFPFVSIDPRRIVEDASFLQYSANNVTGTVTLNDCFVKEFIETKKFNGFKIYPALGYYPFDEQLLILWKYAADHQIPVLTHAIRGNIYYRGTKKKEWGQHLVFEQSKGLDTDEYEPLLLPELKNIDFINNFTHPLNFFCLVEEEMLRKVVARCGTEVKDFFGFIDSTKPLMHDLSELKICFGHYGGADEWANYLEADRDVYSRLVFKEKGDGINFLYSEDGKKEPRRGKIEQIWKQTDWYSIITSLMLQYPNLYSDISYILHDDDIIPLLKKTIQHPKLQKRILFGTDFYVVRNHKSERQMLADLQAHLTEAEFDQIARYNPSDFLRTC